MVKKKLVTKKRLYDRNVVNYITIKKYMVVYWEILVRYMENVKYPPAPKKMDQGLLFYTKRDNGSSHDSQDYVAVMKQFLDDLIAKSALWVSLDNYFKSRWLEYLESLPRDRFEFVPQNESKDYV
eukprot:jgi/Psemu1/18402/gm1.18402_g